MSLVARLVISERSIKHISQMHLFPVHFQTPRISELSRSSILRTFRLCIQLAVFSRLIPISIFLNPKSIDFFFSPSGLHGKLVLRPLSLWCAFHKKKPRQSNDNCFSDNQVSRKRSNTTDVTQNPTRSIEKLLENLARGIKVC